MYQFIDDNIIQIAVTLFFGPLMYVFGLHLNLKRSQWLQRRKRLFIGIGIEWLAPAGLYVTMTVIAPALGITGVLVHFYLFGFLTSVALSVFKLYAGIVLFCGRPKKAAA
jgi:hypothetical protein